MIRMIRLVLIFKRHNNLMDYLIWMMMLISRVELLTKEKARRKLFKSNSMRIKIKEMNSWLLNLG